MRHLTFDVQSFAIGVEDEGTAIRVGDLRVGLPDDINLALREPLVCSRRWRFPTASEVSQLNKVRTIVAAS
jgi:hypothetical protein